ncbi:MAG: hypothetical protein OXT06_12525 [Rhodospirillaceae bacterium]|nr:hypothetical protein [Rhodospirillaceae bacterium]
MGSTSLSRAQFVGIFFFGIPILSIGLALIVSVWKFLHWRDNTAKETETKIENAGRESPGNPNDGIEQSFVELAKHNAHSLSSWELMEVIRVRPLEDGSFSIAPAPFAATYKVSGKRAREFLDWAHKQIDTPVSLIFFFVLAFPLLLHPLGALILFLILALVLFRMRRSINDSVMQSGLVVTSNDVPGYEWGLHFKATVSLRRLSVFGSDLTDYVAIIFLIGFIYLVFALNDYLINYFVLFYTFNPELFELPIVELLKFLGLWYCLAFFAAGGLFMILRQLCELYYRLRLGHRADPADIIPDFEKRLAVVRQKA